MLPSAEDDGRFSLEAILVVRLEGGLAERKDAPEADETLWLRGGINGFIYALEGVSLDTLSSCSCLLSADVSDTYDAEAMPAWWYWWIFEGGKEGVEGLRDCSWLALDLAEAINELRRGLFWCDRW